MEFGGSSGRENKTIEILLQQATLPTDPSTLQVHSSLLLFDESFYFLFIAIARILMTATCTSIPIGLAPSFL